MDVRKDPISEEDLSTLQDGELKPDRAKIVLEAVSRDPQLAMKLGQYLAIEEALKLLDREVLAEPVPAWIDDLLAKAESDHADDE